MPIGIGKKIVTWIVRTKNSNNFHPKWVLSDRIPAGLPPGILVAHKTGDITAVAHDAAIVYPTGRKPYVLVVLTRGITEGAKSAKLIADISSIVFSHNTAVHSAQLPLARATK